MKRLLSILLSLTLVFSLSAAAGAETAEASVVQTQVLVIGGGGAGISAAIAAAEQGAQVLLLEKLGYLGGATIIRLPTASSSRKRALRTALRRLRATSCVPPTTVPVRSWSTRSLKTRRLWPNGWKAWALSGR